MNFKVLFKYGFPIICFSGLLVKWYLGSVSLNDIQGIKTIVYFPCIFNYLTNLECVGCGLTRSIFAIYLWSPHWSFYFHPLGVPLAAMLVFIWLSVFHDRIQKLLTRFISYFKRNSLSVLFILMAWGILRNF